MKNTFVKIKYKPLIIKINMKKTIFKPAAVIALTTVLFASCKKKDTPTPEMSTVTTVSAVTAPAGGFAWTENGGATINADSAFWTTGTWGTGVRAYKGGIANYFEINWGTTQDNTAAGAKPLAVGDVTFLKGAATYTNSATSTLNVTAFASNQLTGDFSVTVTGGTITNIAGAFNAIPKK
jgi:hypothetical protein